MCVNVAFLPRVLCVRGDKQPCSSDFHPSIDVVCELVIVNVL